MGTSALMTSGQSEKEQVLVDGASIAWDIAQGTHATVTLGGNRTLANPTNMKAGGIYVLRAVQDGTGGRTLLYGTAFLFAGGTDIVLTTATANAVDVLVFYCDGTKMLCLMAAKAMAD